jgi:hypothetical protein
MMFEQRIERADVNFGFEDLILTLLKMSTFCCNHQTDSGSRMPVPGEAVTSLTSRSYVSISYTCEEESWLKKQFVLIDEVLILPTSIICDLLHKARPFCK